jgi:hypothetical protein
MLSHDKAFDKHLCKVKPTSLKEVFELHQDTAQHILYLEEPSMTRLPC